MAGKHGFSRGQRRQMVDSQYGEVAHARPMSGEASRRSFAKHSKVHARNVVQHDLVGSRDMPGFVMRGGIRM